MSHPSRRNFGNGWRPATREAAPEGGKTVDPLRDEAAITLMIVPLPPAQQSWFLRLLFFTTIVARPTFPLSSAQKHFNCRNRSMAKAQILTPTDIVYPCSLDFSSYIEF